LLLFYTTMQNHLLQIEQKLEMIIRHASKGLVEIDLNGTIIHLSEEGNTLLKPIIIACNINDNNFFDILDRIAPSVKLKIENASDLTGIIVNDELHRFCFSFGGESIERNFSFTAIKVSAASTIISFDDITQRLLKERVIQQLQSDKALVQGKFEIASNILHDIGNAVVGFGSYIARIKRSLEQNNPGNLQKLSDFFVSQQGSINTAIGESKANAVVNMLSGISESQKNTHEEISNSVKEQLHIITHIQDILNIQRQYVNGHESLEKKPTNLRGIITDCMSMLYASIEKRKINVALSMPETLPPISADRTRLMQVILNVLKNSIEAIDINGTEKNISLCVNTTTDMVVMQIKDSGHGFDKETATQLFERGFTTKATGSGIGLANCKAIMESHDGTIDITSEGFGKGAHTVIKFKIQQ
jgi:signal transduction histidine kinase